MRIAQVTFEEEPQLKKIRNKHEYIIYSSSDINGEPRHLKLRQQLL